MSLARAWRRKLYGAGSVALLVPGAIACALTALALAGGSKPAPAPSQPAPPPPPPKPAPAPTLVDTVVGAGTAVTSQLPAPVGATVTQALQSVGGTLDHVLPATPLQRP